MKRFLHLMGWRANATSHLEKWLSATGALCGIAAIYAVTHWVLPSEAAIWVVASMGASAVLLFAVPHGVLSQPWAVLGGQVLSACAGVICQKLLPGQAFTPALAVGAAILVMHYARCIHPRAAPRHWRQYPAVRPSRPWASTTCSARCCSTSC